ncbi:MAG: histone deacetylase [Vicinamibacterales bacterium]|jgi:acetoin utilization deacetylase AcuC-like enzyme|nr:histone deacetylase [Vicinamibacterales bacterium]MDP7673153.1 histone deacetylase [Vicinamibacterales bacterium]HJN43685.1 histone deacetylase [Vicinamibacterales bacterium]
MLLVGSDHFIDHQTPDGHPEQPARARVMAEVSRRWSDAGGALTAPRPATLDELVRVHTPEYVDQIADTAGQRFRLDADTYTSADSYDVALHAAGAAITAVEHTLTEAMPAIAFVRPPGHHAEPDRAMGFCLFNNVAVAAASARAAGVNRVAILDYDVHHGNGTQWMFYDDPAVLYVSLHQYPFYPGTGAVTDVGRGDGIGFTLNVPLEAGASDADYDRAMREVVGPVVTAFAPELILLSAGYDAHAQDPLGGMQVSTEGFAAMTAHVQRLAETCCQGRLAAVTEGGYDLTALDACLESTLTQLGDGPPASGAAVIGDTNRVNSVIPAVRQALAPYWSGIFR